jgi:hypothetical protein
MLQPSSITSRVHSVTLQAEQGQGGGQEGSSTGKWWEILKMLLKCTVLLTVCSCN